MAMFFVFVLVLVLVLVFLVFRFIYSNLWVPWRTQSHFKKQSVTGPSYRIFSGNSGDVSRLTAEAKSKPIPSGSNPHEFVHRVAPHYHAWSRVYGKTFLYWFGSKLVVATSDPKLIREALTTGGSFDRIGHNPLSKLLYAQGLPGLRGDQWVFHRRIAKQAFTMEKLKRWVPEMVTSTMMLLEKWEEMRNGEEEIELEIHREMHNLSADMLSKTAFGNSVEEGKGIFALQERMMRLFYLVRWSVYIPGFRFFPSKTNREIWRVEKQIRGSILKLIENNKRAVEKSGTLLHAFMSPYTNQNGQEEKLGIEEVIDECKTFYFAAKETTGNLITWVLVLLAMHQEWQKIAREEVLRVLGPTELPTPDILQDLKTLSMIINETLRLYPPAMTLNRDTLKRAKLGNLDIPAGTQLYLSVVAMHHDKETWGNDAEEFNPRRFEDPKKQSALLVPFGLGPRTCVGQNLAVNEAKTVLATILKHYSFRLSPSYAHAPVLLVTLQPQNGAHLLFSRISS
ncbi:Cytochrome P450 [Arabidopsis thaliana x Arabidopsis arenosa]|uniref:Cytochrome P450 n=1 Tax=Arabidopsis thaliana x Arabidopsis arenosa TaxID=1240361 RepID=A0A8T2BL33_9BRAS|nr:Cytochrome P450 [Arabidopsis thaliana x Arabidopsis arenosa]